MNDYLIGFSIGAIIVLTYVVVILCTEIKKQRIKYDFLEMCYDDSKKFEKWYKELMHEYNVLKDDYNELLERFKNKI